MQIAEKILNVWFSEQNNLIALNVKVLMCAEGYRSADLFPKVKVGKPSPNQQGLRHAAVVLPPVVQHVATDDTSHEIGNKKNNYRYPRK